MLLPDTLEDYVGGNNEVRAIDAFIDSLNISSMGFKAAPVKEGRPGYDPRNMLKLYIWLPEPHPFLPAAAERGLPECGADVAPAENCPGFPLHCRLPEKQCESNQGSVQGICKAV